MRVVYDTNIFVSAFTNDQGRAAQAIGNIRSGQDILVISQPIIVELLRVLAHKFSRDEAELDQVAALLMNNSEFVISTETLSALSDEPDNRILECALAGNVDAIVTGDGAMLALGSIGNVRIISLADYLAEDSR